MKKIHIKVESRVIEGFELYYGHAINATCLGKDIEWNRRGIIEASLSLPKTLDFKLSVNENAVECTVKQQHTNAKKTFKMLIGSKDINIQNFEEGLMQIEKEIRKIEDFFKSALDTGIAKKVHYTIGGKK